VGYARPAAPEFVEVELVAWLRELAGFLDGELTRSGVRLNIEAEPPLVLQADAGQLRQIVLNLVRNAHEAFDGKPGQIILAARRERVALRGRATNVIVLSVTDDGPGIPADIQPRLFDPFFTTKPTGTGLVEI